MLPFGRLGTSCCAECILVGDVRVILAVVDGNVVDLARFCCQLLSRVGSSSQV